MVDALPGGMPAQIGREMLAFTERQLARIRWDKGDVGDFLGRFLSTPKPNIVFSPPKRAFTGSLAGKIVKLHPKTRFLYRGALARAGLERLILDWHHAGYLLIEAKG